MKGGAQLVPKCKVVNWSASGEIDLWESGPSSTGMLSQNETRKSQSLENLQFLIKATVLN